jgi:hypothetical protein
MATLLVKAKAVFGVILLVFDFILRQNIKLLTNITNKSKNDSSAKAMIVFHPTPGFARRAYTWAKPNENKYSSR